jgi:ankyrin repeat protein
MNNLDKFFDAARQGDLPRVQKMLADVDARITDADRHGRTALLHAAYGSSSNPTLIWLLIEGGASITDRDNQGNLALLHAAFKGVEFQRANGCLKTVEQTSRM